MIVLALDTTTRSGSVAVLKSSELLLERAGDAAVPHGRRLPGDVLATLDAAGVSLAEVALFAVASGPGAFTGLRIGIATIQGLAFASGRPVVGVSALDATAQEAAARSEAGPATLIGAWMDAARGEVFSALYEVGMEAGGRSGMRTLVAIEGPSVGPPEATLARWRPHFEGRTAVFAGEGARTYQDALRAGLPAGPRLMAPAPLAGTLGRLALAAAERGEAGPPHAVRPLYVRRPDAELARDRAGGPRPSGAPTRS